MSYRVSFRVERRHWNPHQVTSCNRFRLSESNRRKRFHVIQGRPFQSAFIVGFFFEFSIRVDSFLFTCHSVCFSFVVQIPLRNRFFFFLLERKWKKKETTGRKADTARRFRESLLLLLMTKKRMETKLRRLWTRKTGTTSGNDKSTKWSERLLWKKKHRSTGNLQSFPRRKSINVRRTQ